MEDREVHIEIEKPKGLVKFFVPIHNMYGEWMVYDMGPKNMFTSKDECEKFISNYVKGDTVQLSKFIIVSFYLPVL